MTPESRSEGSVWFFSIYLLLLGLSSVTAEATVFTVDRTVLDVHITGFIETDGTTGLLNVTNVLDWDLTFDSPTAILYLTGPLSGNNSTFGLGGDALTVVGDDLVWDWEVFEVAIMAFELIGSGLQPTWRMKNFSTGGGDGSIQEEIVNWPPGDFMFEHPVDPALLLGTAVLFVDGFETGDTTSWSQTTP